MVKLKKKQFKFYLVSFDKDLGGRFFFLKSRSGKDENHPTYAYGRNNYTTILGCAKTYHKLGNAQSMAIKICQELGFKKRVYIHGWNPNLFDATEIVGYV